MVNTPPTEPDFPTPEAAAAYDAWFRAKVEAAMASTAPMISHDEVMALTQRIIEKRRAGFDRSKANDVASISEQMTNKSL